MKKKKELWFNEELIDRIKIESKNIGRNQSEFVEECVLSYLKHKPKIKPKSPITYNQLELLKFFNRCSGDHFFISQLEKVAIRSGIKVSSRSIRDTVKTLSVLGYIEWSVPGDIGCVGVVKYYKITKSGMKLCNSL